MAKSSLLTRKNVRFRSLQEIHLLRTKLDHAVKTVEDAQMAFSDTESNTNQLKRDLLSKKEKNAKQKKEIDDMTKEIRNMKDAIEAKRCVQ